MPLAALTNRVGESAKVAGMIPPVFVRRSPSSWPYPAAPSKEVRVARADPGLGSASRR